LPDPLQKKGILFVDYLQLCLFVLWVFVLFISLYSFLFILLLIFEKTKNGVCQILCRRKGYYLVIICSYVLPSTSNNSFACSAAFFILNSHFTNDFKTSLRTDQNNQTKNNQKYNKITSNYYFQNKQK
jgi:hypothetical protein